MRSFFPIRCWLAVALAASAVVPLAAADWIVAPSYYTHDKSTGQRVAQYSPIGPVYVYGRANYVDSGFQHYRSTIAFGGSVDNYYRVREWGKPVRPFGEWLRPYRPYSVPFPLWNSPYRGMYQFYSGYPGYPPVGGQLPAGGSAPGAGHPAHGGLPAPPTGP